MEGQRSALRAERRLLHMLHSLMRQTESKDSKSIAPEAIHVIPGTSVQEDGGKEDHVKHQIYFLKNTCSGCSLFGKCSLLLLYKA